MTIDNGEAAIGGASYRDAPAREADAELEFRRRHLIAQAALRILFDIMMGEGPGHPVADMQDDANVQTVFGPLDGTKRVAPGQLSEILGTDVLAHDCSTTNGSSGSPLIDFNSYRAVGLHYFGKPGERNEAVFLPAIARHPGILKSASREWGI